MFLIFIIFFIILNDYIYNFVILVFDILGDWGLGIGVWGLGVGANPQSPIPNPQSPIPII